MNKCILALIAFFLQIWIVQADDTERQMFLKNGFNWKHYEQAQRLNLDLENYTTFYSNKSNRIKGAIMVGIGGGGCGTGLYFIFFGSLMKSAFDYDYDYDDDYSEDEADFPFNFLIVSGGICVATGVGLIMGGIIKRNNTGKVFTKNGTQISLRPKLDLINNRYGAQLSLSF